MTLATALHAELKRGLRVFPAGRVIETRRGRMYVEALHRLREGCAAEELRFAKCGTTRC